MITLDAINKAVALLKKQAIRPCVVKDSLHAKIMTLNDPAGKVWHVGEEYYMLHRRDGSPTAVVCADGISRKS